MILTDVDGKKFYVNIDQVETITPVRYRGGCEITFVSGHSVVCVEEFQDVVEKFEINKALSK